MEVFILGLIKILDNIVGTAKNITVYKNKKILSSLLVILSQFMFYFVIKSVTEDGSLITILAICICSGIGTYIAMFANDKLKKESTFTNILTCNHEYNITELCDYLLANKIK